MSSSVEKLASALSLSDLGKSKELRDRIIFTLLALIVYRIGTYVPLPGINAMALEAIVQQNSAGILGMFNMLSGGALGRMTIFALNIMPYITASIIMQLMTVLSKEVENMKKEGEAGRRKINQYTRYLTIILAAIQAYGISVGLERMNSAASQIVMDPGWFFRASVVITLVAGTAFLMWLGDQITARGIGNGISLIIFAGIVAGLPNALGGLFELGRKGVFSTIFILAIVVLAMALVYAIVFMERAQRRILVQYPKRQVGNKVYGGETSHMPLKINTAGVIPPIFASSILLFPATIVSFGAVGAEQSEFAQFVMTYLAHGKPLYIALFVFCVMFFSFFYTSIIFNSEETAENLKKYGGFIPGRRPGKHTAEYFDYVLTRLTVIGAIYIAVICVVPEILIAQYSVPFYLGGTSLLIVVNVVMDTINQTQTHLFAHKYESLIKKSRIQGKKK